jgi:hypothetical protein
MKNMGWGINKIKLWTKIVGKEFREILFVEFK